MKRRSFLKSAIILPILSSETSSLFARAPLTPVKRVRPGDAGWPSTTSWEQLNKQVNGRLIKITSPLSACKTTTETTACKEVFASLKNPYYLGDEPALTQTSGYLDAWESAPSQYAVAAETTADIAAAVNFAREHNLRLVIKGGGHSYQGTSNCADSLLIWTRKMNHIVIHDHFAVQGGPGKQALQPAVTVEAGAIWMQAYNAVTTKGGRYVQGGGCTTVGVAGLIQSGGFGSLSKYYGMAAAGLLEAEVVTAEGKVRIVNEYNYPDLFWALKGGGGGSMCVVTKLTLRTRELPEFFGVVFGRIKARNNDAFKKLLTYTVNFYQQHLFNPVWGEQIRFYGDNSLHINMMFAGLTQQQAIESWQPLINWVNSLPQDFSWEQPLMALALPARHLWDVTFLKKYAPNEIITDDRPGAPEENVYWASGKEEAGQFLLAYHSTWLPEELLQKNKQHLLVDALFAASRYWTVSLHFNKGLAGAHAEDIQAARNTATNPAVLHAFALAIIAGENTEPKFISIKGHEPDLTKARQQADRINKASAELRKIVPNAGSYVSESNYFEQLWQQSFWGANYAQLLTIKNKYDPNGLFFVHHGVGSETWSKDGFTKL